jgi:hypothetical protein
MRAKSKPFAGGEFRLHAPLPLQMEQPRKIWWARPRKLCALERPGGGGRSHRRARREAEIAWLRRNGVRLVVSVMPSRHNLPDYERAGLEHRHVPVAKGADAPAALDELLRLLRRELRSRGAVAVHGDYVADAAVAACALHLRDLRGTDPAESLAAAAEAGLELTPEAEALVSRSR